MRPENQVTSDRYLHDNSRVGETFNLDLFVFIYIYFYFLNPREIINNNFIGNDSSCTIIRWNISFKYLFAIEAKKLERYINSHCIPLEYIFVDFKRKINKHDFIYSFSIVLIFFLFRN